MNENERISKAGGIISRLRKPTFVFNMATGDKRSPVGSHKRMLKAADEIIAEVERDEYHTMEELYLYRMLYNAHAAHGWHQSGIPVVKSFHHSDGELCFGGGWFIVIATLPTGQVSNHYKAEFWPLFSIPSVERPPEYDGHTPAEAARRLESFLLLEGVAYRGKQDT